MLSMHAEPQIELMLIDAERKRSWLAAGLVALCLLVVLAIYGRTFLAMVQVWQESATFTHGYLVLPAFFFFVWQRRFDLARTPLRPFAPAALLLAGAGLVWLLSEIASAAAPSEFAMVAMVPLVIVAVLGWRFAQLIVFPLAFLFFAVPFGEVFVPTLMEWTANFTVLALRSSGVPVLSEGQHLTIPSGQWSVVEACSGIRYLIASMFVGLLFSWQMYRSPMRRALFLCASIVVPIVANWLRAYMIVMLGHLSGNRLAVGVDHLIYGWIFFGVVMLLLLSVGAVWREDPLPASSPSDPAGDVSLQVPESVNWKAAGSMALVVAGILLLPPVAASLLMRPYAEREIPMVVVSAAPGWVQVPPTGSWRPQLVGARSEQRLSFEKDGRRVGVYLGFFRDQRQGSKLVNSLNVLVRNDGSNWTSLKTGSRMVEIDGSSLTLQSQHMRGVDGTMVAWQWYWLQRVSTGSDVRAKIELAVDRLLRRDDTSAWIAVYVLNPESVVAGERVLEDFVAEMGGALNRALKEVAS
jgi:exosortase A